VYAADHGCNIINCSWGGSFSGETGQDAITYATINRNCLVLASAGNSSIDESSYPASYQYVTSVAATSNTDIKASFSTYN
jgi:subtilisin family serine protease